MAIEEKARARLFGGFHVLYEHHSAETGTPMQFAVFLPPQAESGPRPCLWWLSGLTCTWENAATKAGFQRRAAELGLVLIYPDTSPRGLDLPGEHDSYDFGSGAGFYLNATQDPWSKHYRMEDYVTKELQSVARDALPIDPARQGVFGHSMGGHGALTLGLKNPELYRSISAFAPIASPINCPWGEKALSGYLGADRAAWRRYDACALIEDGARAETGLLVDQGLGDAFLEKELKPELLEAACAGASVDLTLRRQDGYDHSYWFMASFGDDHLEWHATRLN